MKALCAFGSLLILLSCGLGQAQEPKADDFAKTLSDAKAKGLGWLVQHQEKDGSWGKTHTIAVTSWAVLTFLSATDEPFSGAHASALARGIAFLRANQKDGMYKTQGHSWIHLQGFATLALAETYGRSLRCKVKPDMDAANLKKIVAQAVKIIGQNQSASGGWWYTPGDPNNHEGSTTVCAVQAIVSAANFKIARDDDVLDKGFEYLKKCQTKEGGFNYRLGDGTNMKEGTAAAVATLGLMQKFDFQVMINGYNFLQKITPTAVSQGGFPYYGHFYGTMGMHLLWQEYRPDKEFSSKTQAYIKATQKDLISWQQEDGSFPVKGWATSSENAGYATAFALMALYVPESRLSIYNRTPPKL